MGCGCGNKAVLSPEQVAAEIAAQQRQADDRRETRVSESDRLQESVTNAMANASS